jgi:L-ascorbate metabolism protein UlaG (beta-lactamase superfamily)
MKLTWYGHSAFRIEVGASKILNDPQGSCATHP